MNAIQKCIISIYSEVIAICEKNNIPYYAIGGTCIGAVRNGGFIPWDDDLDIAVPIEEFGRLKKLLSDCLPNYLKIYDCDNIKKYHYIWMKVQDTRTTFIQNTLKRYPEAYGGVFVDIMPISGVPTDPKERKDFINKIKLYRIFNNVRRFPFCKQDSKKGKLASALLKLPLSPFKYNYFSDKYMSLLRKYPLMDAKEVGYVWSPQDIERWYFPKEWFGDTVELPFEDVSIRCPIKYHEYLTKQFGDYMTPPPVEQQKAVHDGFVDLEHPYSDYQSGIRKIEMQGETQ